MKQEMLINDAQPEECRIAIVEDGLLEELYVAAETGMVIQNGFLKGEPGWKGYDEELLKRLGVKRDLKRSLTKNLYICHRFRHQFLLLNIPSELSQLLGGIVMHHHHFHCLVQLF